MTSVPGCQIWYDASTITSADDAEIAAWSNHLGDTDYDLTAASQVFPRGSVIYGRWTAFKPSASGVICYFGK